MTENYRHSDEEMKRLRDLETQRLKDSVPKHGPSSIASAKEETQHSALGTRHSAPGSQQFPVSTNLTTSKYSKDSHAQTQDPGPRTQDLKTNSLEWYAIYTKARNEKKVHERLLEQGVESYLPLVKTLRQWSDRKKWVEVPLLSSYVFVKVPQHQLREVIQVDGAAKYISFEGKPAAIPDKQIDNLRLLVNGEADIEVTGERLSPGDPVEVTTGSLRGLTGELIKINNKNKVVVRIDRLDINLVVKIQKAFLKKIR